MSLILEDTSNGEIHTPITQPIKFLRNIIKIGEICMCKASSDIDKLKVKGKQYFDRYEWEKAQNVFEQILDIDPQNLFALDKIGVIFVRKDELNSAEYYFRKILSIDHTYKTALNNLGNILLKRGMVEQAINCYRKAIQIDENYALAYHNLAVAYKKKGHIDRYIKNIKKSTRLERRRNTIGWRRLGL